MVNVMLNLCDWGLLNLFNVQASYAATRTNFVSPLPSEFDSVKIDAVVMLDLATGDDPDDPRVPEEDLPPVLQPHYRRLLSVHIPLQIFCLSTCPPKTILSQTEYLIHLFPSVIKLMNTCN